MIIIGELNRLRTKYSSPTWQAAALMSGILVEYLDEYIAEQYVYLAGLSTDQMLSNHRPFQSQICGLIHDTVDENGVYYPQNVMFISHQLKK